MVQVYRTSELIDFGLSGSEILQAQKCCLHRIRKGHFFVTHRCEEPTHAQVHEFPTLEQSRYPEQHHDIRDKIESLRIQIRSRLHEVRSGDAFSHLSAALLHGLDLPFPASDRVEIIRPGRHEKYSTLLVRNRPISPQDVVKISDFTVTSIDRTLIDLAHDYQLEVSVPIISAALRLSKTTKTALLTRLTPGRRGCRNARIALALSDPLHESQAESLCAVKFHRFGITDMIAQVDVFDASGRLIGRSDFRHKNSAVIVEVHGILKYYLSPDGPNTAAKANHDRHMRLVNEGYTVFNLTWGDLFRASIFHQIKKALAESRVNSREQGP